MKILFISILILTYAFSSNSKPLKTSSQIMPDNIDMDILLPYYGGLKGHYAQIKDGAIQRIFKHPNITIATTTIATTTSRSFEEDFLKIQSAAARLVVIQEMAKNKGAFSAEDNRIYAESLLELGRAAQNLAMLQQTGQIEDFSVLLQPGGISQSNNSIRPTTDESEKSPITSAASVHEILDIKPTTMTTDSSMEFDLLPSIHKDPYDEDIDDVVLMPPKKGAPIAEAKPVGVSIVGEGGIASAKPNAVALSGHNGLAVASPKATAIAGVTAEEAAAFSISLPSRNHIFTKNSKKQQQQQQQQQPQQKQREMRQQSNYLEKREDFNAFTYLSDKENKKRVAL